MKCCDMNAGQLNSLIVIERKTRVSDGVGGTVSTWAADPAGGVWAKWEAKDTAVMFIAEKQVGAGIGTENRISAIIHFRGDAYGAPYYSSADRVLYRNRYYGITSAIDAEDRQMWITLALIEGTPS
jgi:head-tail adaptor